jgi:hypothetical protein
MADYLGVPFEALIVSATDGSATERRSSELAETVGKLMEVEDKLRKLLIKEGTRATKRGRAATHRGGDGNKPR